ncbi:MAG TPA: Mur ligase family protein [Candidatus Paceibacterota bacterium]|nr:Mur ligase family protein [Candidatus Paceibacterota bacterium]
MKRALIRSLRFVLRRLARLTLWRYRPGIVGVTGSAGKTSTKYAIKAVLEGGRRVRVSEGNLNNDLGLPLAILGDWSPKQLRLISRAQPPGTARLAKAAFWIRVIVGSAWRILVKSGGYPEILVLEYGADRPGDIKYLLQIARPNVSVITAVGDVPVHVEFYPGPPEVAREKGRLIEYLTSEGYAVLNGDDELVRALQSRTRAHVMTFGFSRGTEMRASRFENKIDAEGQPVGISFKLEYGGGVVPVRIPGVFGRAHAYSAAAAAAVGVVFGMNLVAISEALTRYRPPASRMQVLAGDKQSWIIDDSYNASPIAMQSALEALGDLPAKRRVAVLGDMLEIGKYTMETHERMGRLAAEKADILVTVGTRAKFLAEAAVAARMRRERVMSFDTAEQAAKPVRDLLKKGDVVLVKGSHAIGLHDVVREIRAHGPAVASRPPSSSVAPNRNIGL